MSVASFTMDEKDLTANLEGTKVIDPQTGKASALIKIVTSEQGFTFDIGLYSPIETQPQNDTHPSEIWLYAPAGVMTISIQHRLLGKIDKYDLGGRLQAGRTYILVLTTNQVNTFTYDESKQQYLDLIVSPTSANVSINGLHQQLDNEGKASILLPVGQHRLSVKAQDYHSVDRTITINDTNQKQSLSIQLKPEFGWLTVRKFEQAQDAELYIDEHRVGTLPIEAQQLHSGPHTISVRHPLYKEYNERISIQDSTTTTLSPRWEANYADVNISVGKDPEVEIYSDGQKLGDGDWSGRLCAGTHQLEARKKSHTTTYQTLTVEVGVPRSVSMPIPTPIYGGLEVQTTPSDAIVSLDGKVLGKSSFVNRNILIGEHEVTIEHKGYKTETFNVDIRTGEVTQIQKQLTDYCTATISSSPWAQVYINDSYMGTTPYQLNLVAGTYRVRLEKDDYQSYNKKLLLDGSTRDINVELKRNYVQPFEFYVQAGYNPQCCSGITIGFGGYIFNFNMEMNLIASSSKSEPIYWSDPSNDKQLPIAATYKPAFGYVYKMGYGIRLNRRLRLTPQAGIQYVQLTESMDSEDVITDPYVCSFTIGVRCSLALARHVGLSLTPEYLAPIGKSDGYKVLSDVSNDIKSFGTGFNTNVSLNIFF